MNVNPSFPITLIFLASITALISYAFFAHQATKQLPVVDPAIVLKGKGFSQTDLPKISIIIPAFNEEENIQECIASVLDHTLLAQDVLEVWVIDDQSTDRTFEILQTLQVQRRDPRLKIIRGLPRPTDKRWTGKNWACHQASKQAAGNFLLFIDADMRLQDGAVVAAVQTAIDQQIDLLTCIPTIKCGSLIEWLVQPLMFTNLLVSLNTKAVKDPKTKNTYALGPFLLFRALTYHQLGGHSAVASDVAEDVAFAKLIKMNGFKIQQALGKKLATLRMYRNWSTLWEGWTKVLYVGSGRSVFLMLFLVMVMLLTYTVPWIGLAIAIMNTITHPTFLHYVETALLSLSIMLQYWMRRQCSQALGTSTKYWWLQAAGGIIISILAIASIIKTETGWGWTWRGRQLSC